MTKTPLSYDADPEFKPIIYELDSLQSPSLLLLRGHLLIEVLLRRFLESRAKDRSAIDDARLSFNQVLCLVRSRFKKGTATKLWSYIGEINRIRNTLAHRLDPSDFNSQWRAFVRRFQRDFPNSERHEIDALRQVLLSTAKLLGNSLKTLEINEVSLAASRGAAFPHQRRRGHQANLSK